MTKEFILPEGRILVVTVTEEGVIMDAYQGALLGTIGMMADEWFDYITEPECNHDAPYLQSGDMCECGKIKP